jgi:hypothetical protein
MEGSILSLAAKLEGSPVLAALDINQSIDVALVADTHSTIPTSSHKTQARTTWCQSGLETDFQSNAPLQKSPTRNMASGLGIQLHADFPIDSSGGVVHGTTAVPLDHTTSSYASWQSPDLSLSYPAISSLDDLLVLYGLRTPTNPASHEHVSPILCPVSNPPAMPLFAADINMFDALYSRQGNDECVNPNDMLSNGPRQDREDDVLGAPQPWPQVSSTPCLSGAMDNIFVQPPLTEGLNHLPFSDITNQIYGLVDLPPLPAHYYPSDSYIDHGASRALADYSATTVQQVQHKRVRRDNVRAEVDSAPGEFIQSPVLNAHLGIAINDLVRRAANYRARNPGKPLCQQWLLAYAGQLSDRGEQLGEWRCYVIGCTHTNKRRDHILTHVGSHVDERPYQCDHWSVLLVAGTYDHHFELILPRS